MGLTDCFVKQSTECCKLYCKLNNMSEMRLIDQRRLFAWSKFHGKINGSLNLFKIMI